MNEEETLTHSNEMARGTFWGLAGSFFTKIISFLYVVYVARAISQGDVGVFYLALGVMGLLGAWRDFGLPSALGRYIPFFQSRGENTKVKSLLSTTYSIGTITGLLMTVALLVLAAPIGEFYQNPRLADALSLFAIFMLLENLSKISAGFLQGVADIKSGQLVGNVQTILKLVLTVAFVQMMGPSYAALIYGLLVSYAIALLLSFMIVFWHVKRLKTGGEGIALRQLAYEIVPFGLMMSVLQLLWTLLSYLDRTMIGYLLPVATAEAAVGVYSLANVLALNVMVFPGAVGAIFLPLISRMVGKEDRQGIRQAIGSSQRWVLMITLPITFVMIAFAPEMIATIYGASYSAGANVMVLFSIGTLFTVFSFTIALALAGMRLVKLELKVAFVAVLLNLILNLFLIPVYGIDGAAIASAASFLLSMLLFLHYGKKMIGFESPKSAYILAGCGIATFALLVLIKPYLVLLPPFIPQLFSGELSAYWNKIAYLGFLGCVTLLSYAVFGLGSIALKCFEREDVEVMKSFARKGMVPPALIKFAEKILLKGVVK